MINEKEEEEDILSPHPAAGKLQMLHIEDSSSPILSPFTRIQNDLEQMMTQFDNDTEAKLAGKPKIEEQPFVSRQPKLSQPLQMPKRPPSGTCEYTNVNDNCVSRSLWIGNLDPTITEAELRTEFEPFGKIESLRLLPTKECAFVNYVSIEDAVRAKERLQGTALGNMIIRIGYGKLESNSNNSNNNETVAAKPSSASPPSNCLSTNDLNTRSVWIGHIGPEVDVEMLTQAFSKFGEIESCRILEIKKCAFVNFFNPEDAARARSLMNGAKVGVSTIKTGYAKTNNGNGGKTDMNGMTQATLEFNPSLSGVISNRSFTNQISMDDSDIVMSTKNSSATEFKMSIPALPIEGCQLPDELSSTVIRECRRRIEHNSATKEEIDTFANQIIDYVLAASVDPVGNILVQKLIEKGSEGTRDEIIERLGPLMASVGVHKNGTWVVQKLINFCQTKNQQKAMAETIRPHLVPLLQDQFGNYVVQCCLMFGPAGNQFIFDSLYHQCVEIATSRFGSRAMRSCLESSFASERQKVHPI